MINQQAVQTREETILHHRERLNAVLLHIQENIDAPLTVETLAAVAGFSPYYFHRIFAAYLHETTSDYVRRIRLEWAARRLILSGDQVTQIALAAGYETAAAFGRAFKKRYQVSPRAFRRLRRPTLYATNWEPLLLQPEIRQRPGHELVYIPCVGAEADSETVWTTLKQHTGGAGGAASAIDPFEPPSYVQVRRDRPNEGNKASSKMRVDAGILLEESASIQPRKPVGVQHLAGGLYAVFHHHGRRRDAMWQAIYKRWLPQSHVSLRDAPPYAESTAPPVVQNGRDQSIAFYVPINGSLYELQKKESQMSPTVKTVTQPDRQMISITRHVYIGELKDHLRESYEQLAALIAETGVEQDGKPVAIYHGEVNEEKNGPVEVGVPVKTAPPVSGDIKSGTLVGGSIAYVELTLRQAHFPEILGYYDIVYKWIEENGLQIAGSPREEYATSPMDNKAVMDQPFLDIVWPYK
ncbi:MAG: helix-turn-helix domain-containing protein [Caldilineaceae bacterium]|nr:helix-turn-helix domain-containing protein [Caldilineaceae bacterium]